LAWGESGGGGGKKSFSKKEDNRKGPKESRCGGVEKKRGMIGG